MSRRTSLAAAVALGALLTLSACTAPAPEKAPAEKRSDFVGAVEPTWSVAANLAGDPTYQDGYVAAYVVDAAGALGVVAWDAATGTELWRDVATPGGVTQGVELALHSVETGGTPVVAYLRAGGPADEGWQHLVVADMATGAELPVDKPTVWATASPADCASGEGFCFSGWLIGNFDAGQLVYRADPATGAVTEDTDVAMAPNSRLLGERVSSTLDRAPDGAELLGYGSGGALAWQVPYTEVFGEGYSSDAGWGWALYPDDDVLVGNGAFSDPANSDALRDVTKQTVVGLDPASGEVLWRLAGHGPCAAGELPYDDTADTITFCAFHSGALTFDDTTSVVSGLDVDLVGVDPRSGDIRWTLPLGSAASNFHASIASFATGSTVRPLDVDGTTKLVDLQTGKADGIAAGSVFGCETKRPRLQAAQPGDGEAGSYTTGFSEFACSSDLAAVDTPLSAGAVRMAGTKVGDGTYLVATAGELTAYALED